MRASPRIAFTAWELDLKLVAKALWEKSKHFILAENSLVTSAHMQFGTESIKLAIPIVQIANRNYSRHSDTSLSFT